MAIVSTGQLTLTDLNDTKQLILYLNPNYRTQIYDPNASTYTPNFTSTNLIIQPELYVAGGSGSNMLPNGATPIANSQVKSVTWYEGTQTTTAIAEGSTTDYTITTGSASSVDKKLTVKTNFTSKNSQIFTCVVVYTDPDTSFDVTLKANVDIVKITNGQKGTNGTSGTDAFYLNVWTPDGDTIRNSSGSLKVKADLYKGAGIQSSSVTYKWYQQDPTATTSSGGDTDGGAGWRLLNATYNDGVTNYTTNEITVPSGAIDGVEGYQCVATYSTGKYKGVAILKDFQDPVSVNILGANIFKNGQGSVTLTAQLIRAGVEIPTAGYTFAWSIYNANGSLVKALSSTTDTVTVNATDINGIGNVVCDVSK